ncbi:MAG: quinoprotein relay system zinc metallohydrolase 2 [Candidatus Porifericomitaceae bacterium WSBS_2022_MAG_OTU9]
MKPELRCYLNIVAGALLWGGCQAAHAAPAQAGITLEQIGNGVYVHYGQHLGVEHHGREDIANLGVVVGPDCIAVIDTGGSVAVGKKLRQAIGNISTKPICHVINTHIHFDHVLGNPAFADAGASFAGHWQLPEALVANRDFFTNDFAAEIGQSQLPEPNLEVLDSHEISLGPGRILKLRAWPAAHSHSDLTVLDEASGVIFAGDLVFQGRIPTIDGELLGWIEVMSQLRTIEVQKIVPGHGRVANNWEQALQEQSRYLLLLRDEVREALANLVFMEDAIDTVGLSEQPHWQLFDSVHRRNVSKAFVELEWE